MFVFRMCTFILILKCLIISTRSESLHKAIPDVQVNKLEVANAGINSTEPHNEAKAKQTVVGEGGEKFESTNSPPSNAKSTTERSDIQPTPVSTRKFYGREGELVENHLSSTTNADVHMNPTAVTAETGGVKPVTESTAIEAPATEKSVVTNTQPTKSPHSRIVPKKGVSFNDSVITSANISSTVVASTIKPTQTISTTATTTTVNLTNVVKQVHKPTVTTGSDNKNEAVGKEKSIESSPKVPTIEYYQRKNEDNKRSSFVIPIVGVILSVPIVAIVINILYKRCKEWWSHRHYSRMDFLIDGMYNN